MSQSGLARVSDQILPPDVLTNIAVQTGTSPVVPAGNTITFNGATVAAGTNPVQTNGTGPNTMALQVQFSQAIAATNGTNVGLSAFNSSQFTVDANGFVSLSGGGTPGILTLTGNSGGAISPVAGNINTVGTGSITIAGAGNTLTTQLTGLTNHAVLVGAGTATITKVGPTATSGQVLQSQGSSADPAFSTATYPSTTTINQILYSSSANTVTGLATTNSAVLVTTSAGAPTFSSTMTNGQVIIGSTGATPTAAALTPGTGISITNGAGSITIASTGSVMTWTDEATSFAAAAGNGYFVTGTATATLPASPSQGNTIAFIVDAANILTVTANTGQVIRISSSVSATAGTAASSARGDSLTLVFRSSDNAWIAQSVIGNWTVT